MLQFLRTARRSIPGYSEDLDVCVLGQEGVDYASALFSGGTDDEDRFGHCGLNVIYGYLEMLVVGVVYIWWLRHA